MFNFIKSIFRKKSNNTKCDLENKNKSAYERYYNNKIRYYRESDKCAYNKNSKWTEEDLDLVIKYTHLRKDKELAELLGRSIPSIYSARRRCKKVGK